MPESDVPTRSDMLVTPRDPKLREMTAARPRQVFEVELTRAPELRQRSGGTAPPSSVTKYPLTPEGHGRRSRIHQIEAGQIIKAGGDRLFMLENRKIIAGLGSLLRSEEDVPQPKYVLRAGPGKKAVAAMPTGWIVDTRQNRLRAPVSSLRTHWTVPTDRSARSGET
jgi:hypothetical protein